MALEQPPLLYFGRDIVPWETARVHVWTEVVLRAASVFEGIRGYWNAAESRHYFLHLERHYDRLERSARLAHIPFHLTRDELPTAVHKLTAALGYRQDLYLRPTLYLDSGRYTTDAQEQTSGFFMPIFPVGRAGSIIAGVRCMVSTWQRTPDEAMPARAKAAANYFNLRLARLEAESYGFDEAILLNSRGNVSETAGASVFVVRDGLVCTPATTESILESITRASAIELLRGRGYEVVERALDPTELYVADEVFLTGTLAEITPVREIDQHTIGRGTTGEVTRSLQALYYDICSSGARDLRGWLTAGPVL